MKPKTWLLIIVVILIIMQGREKPKMAPPTLVFTGNTPADGATLLQDNFEIEVDKDSCVVELSPTPEVHIFGFSPDYYDRIQEAYALDREINTNFFSMDNEHPWTGNYWSGGPTFQGWVYNISARAYFLFPTPDDLRPDIKWAKYKWKIFNDCLICDGPVNIPYFTYYHRLDLNEQTYDYCATHNFECWDYVGTPLKTYSYDGDWCDFDMEDREFDVTSILNQEALADDGRIFIFIKSSQESPPYNEPNMLQLTGACGQPQFHYQYYKDNSSMDSGFYHYTGLTAGTYTFRSYCNDTGIWEYTEERTVNIGTPAAPATKMGFPWWILLLILFMFWVVTRE